MFCIIKPIFEDQPSALYTWKQLLRPNMIIETHAPRFLALNVLCACDMCNLENTNN